MANLNTERDQLLAWLQEVESSIQEEEASLSKIPASIEEQKYLMAKTFNELQEIHAKKKEIILGTQEEDNRQIADIDAIRQNALDLLKSFLNL